jgi:hypothetical protein
MSRQNFCFPFAFLKRKRKEDELEDGKTPDSNVVVYGTSAYVDVVVFMDWMKNNFISRDHENFCFSLVVTIRIDLMLMFLTSLQRMISHPSAFQGTQRVICNF